jgi:hypothetical protein
MNRILFLSFVVFSLVACEKEESPSNVLQYDGNNVTAPILGPGIHEFAVRFTRKELEPYIGRKLAEVSFFAGNNPDGLDLLIYGAGTDKTPGAQLYRARLNNINNPQWYEHKIAQGVDITGEDLWISIRVTHVQTQQSVGCDAGPSKEGGDWIKHFDERDWLTFRNYTSTASQRENINWNIRGIVGQ